MASSMTPATPDKRSTPGTTASAILVVAVIAAAAILIVVVLAFSTDNTPASIDGRTATTSQFQD
jgi:hypothetical protein